MSKLKAFFHKVPETISRIENNENANLAVLGAIVAIGAAAVMTPDLGQYMEHNVRDAEQAIEDIQRHPGSSPLEQRWVDYGAVSTETPRSGMPANEVPTYQFDPNAYKHVS